MVSSVFNAGALAPFLNLGSQPSGTPTGASVDESAPIENLQGTAAHRKLAQALAEGQNLEKSLNEQKGAVASKMLEWLDRLMDNYLQVARLAQQLGQPKLAAHLMRQADQFLSRGPGYVADARAAIPADGNTDAAILALHRRVDSIAVKAQALATAVATAARNAPEAASDLQPHIGGALESAKAMAALAQRAAADTPDNKAASGDNTTPSISLTA